MQKYTAMMLLAPLLVVSAQVASSETDLDWMAGRWCSGDASELIEETWLAPRGGELLGISRTLKGERSAAFEFLRIAVAEGVPTYFAQPGGRPPTPFKRSAGGADWVRFENAAHDFPKRIEYRRSGDNLRAEIAGPGAGGEEMVIGFDFQPCPD